MPDARHDVLFFLAAPVQEQLLVRETLELACPGPRGQRAGSNRAVGGVSCWLFRLDEDFW